MKTCIRNVRRHKGGLILLAAALLLLALGAGLRPLLFGVRGQGGYFCSVHPPVRTDAVGEEMSFTLDLEDLAGQQGAVLGECQGSQIWLNSYLVGAGQELDAAVESEYPGAFNSGLFADQAPQLQLTFAFCAAPTERGFAVALPFALPPLQSSDRPLSQFLPRELRVSFELGGQVYPGSCQKVKIAGEKRDNIAFLVTVRPLPEDDTFLREVCLGGQRRLTVRFTDLQLYEYETPGLLGRVMS